MEKRRNCSLKFWSSIREKIERLKWWKRCTFKKEKNRLSMRGVQERESEREKKNILHYYAWKLLDGHTEINRANISRAFRCTVKCIILFLSVCLSCRLFYFVFFLDEYKKSRPLLNSFHKIWSAPFSLATFDLIVLAN